LGDDECRPRVGVSLHPARCPGARIMNGDRNVVFVVDDDLPTRTSLINLLRSVGLTVQAFPSAREFLAAPRPDVPGCLVLDVRLPELSGLDLQRRMAGSSVHLPI